MHEPMGESNGRKARNADLFSFSRGASNQIEEGMGEAVVAPTALNGLQDREKKA